MDYFDASIQDAILAVQNLQMMSLMGMPLIGAQINQDSIPSSYSQEQIEQTLTVHSKLLGFSPLAF